MSLSCFSIPKYERYRWRYDQKREEVEDGADGEDVPVELADDASGLLGSSMVEATASALVVPAVRTGAMMTPSSRRASSFFSLIEAESGVSRRYDMLANYVPVEKGILDGGGEGES